MKINASDRKFTRFLQIFDVMGVIEKQSPLSTVLALGILFKSIARFVDKIMCVQKVQII